MASDVAVVERLERDLLTTALRGDRERLEQLLHPDFTEIGQSGRPWSREDLIAELVEFPDVGDVEVHELAVEPVAADVLLVSYLTRRAGSRTRRSSLWVRQADRWVVRFHQGTPVQTSE